MALRCVAGLFVPFALCACSLGGGTSTDAEGVPRTSTTTTAIRAADFVEIPVEAAARKGGKFASRRELEWAAAWMRWDKRFERMLSQTESILAVPDRRERAIPPGSRDHRIVVKTIRVFRSCAEDAVARGAPPSTRLERLAVETAAVCERVEKAGARLDSEGFGIGFPPEAILADPHLRNAVGEAWSFVPGLEPGVPLSEGRSRRTRTQILYTVAASRLVGEQVTVTCYSRGDWRRRLAGLDVPPRVAGFVEVHGAVGNLAPGVCAWLDRLVYADERPEELSAKADAAQAVLVLAHEAQHAAGIGSEAKAECYGMQDMRDLGRLFHLGGSYSEKLAEFFWTRMYPFEEPPYASDACRPGGPLDRRPHVASWP